MFPTYFHLAIYNELKNITNDKIVYTIKICMGKMVKIRDNMNFYIDINRYTVKLALNFPSQCISYYLNLCLVATCLI